MKNLLCSSVVSIVILIIINMLNVGDGESSRSRNRLRSLLDKNSNNNNIIEEKFQFDLNHRKTSPVLGNNINIRQSNIGRDESSKYVSSIYTKKDNEIGKHRMSRQIKPISCTVDDFPGTSGTCMFVFDCNQANGTHLGVCRDGFYIGSCCKLPEKIMLPHEDDSFNEILPKPTKIPTQSSTTTTEKESIVTMTEVVTDSTFPEEDKRKPTTTTTTSKPKITTTVSPTKNRTELRDADFFSENGTLLISNPKLICGRQFLPASRIVGGNDAYYGKWPWQISVRTWQNDARTFIHSCGAALINENWAISAMHCFDKVMNQDVILRIGDFDLSDNDVPFNYTERRIQLVIPHPKFFGPAKTFEYDLALIRFYEPVVFQPNIVPICIPDELDDFVGRIGFVTGWGRLYEGGPIPARLNEVQVPIMNNTECENMFLKAGYIEKIPHIFLCAGWPEGEKDSCEGDSGGPLVLQTGSDNHWSLIGVISWGIGCSRISHPGVYTRITEFRDWINLVVEF